MIAVTTNTVKALRRMTNSATYPDAGLSIKKVDDRKYAMSIVPAPADSDVAVPGVNVYLDQQAAVALDDATLDAESEASLAKHFILR
ncbi:hypothetical protein M1L60_44510 [Actinoplanes sp. TRM 88003]|uniref:Uncharacterized protein n=1 Tax=Paractinoplanes aksuensis TaxID=2939490 RepID=A0ABT1E472_9ACTN|nr:hypothetical protein [Actinoplanes aksuensis]MCO8277663.1 hypothetical protein [Actinoplanes aksuensis]